VTEREHTNERRYQMAMSVVRALLESHSITKEDYGQIDTILTEKFSPTLGSLLSDKSLIYGRKYGNIDPAKG